MNCSNQDLILQTIQFLSEAKVEIVIVCAGARNAPLVLQLEQTPSIKCISFFEERSAGFFAMGLTKSSQKSVAVVTTSGTAVAELLPSAIEATYQGLPVIYITADRPKSYRGSGAPQAIHQVGLFSHYVEQCLDWDKSTEDFSVSWNKKKPIQLNLCFDEPLMDSKSDHFQIRKNCLAVKNIDFSDANTSVTIENPLIILGQIDSSDQGVVFKWLESNSCPIYAESLSLLRGHSKFSDRLILSGEEKIKDLFRDRICQSIIRIGGIPTLRFWRDLEFEFKHIPVFNFSNLPYTGLARQAKIWSFHQLNLIRATGENITNFFTIDRFLQQEKEKLLTEFSTSEPSFVRRISQIIKNQPLYLGNSLPIREWDQFALFFDQQQIYGNRGANGIDGQVSTYLGWSELYRDSWCFVGDLTALYDMAALGFTKQLNGNFRRIVIMNNKGGHIFKKLFKSELFLNSHAIEFRSWAEMWGWDYQKITSLNDFICIEENKSKNLIIELQPSIDQTDSFWKNWNALCHKL